MSETQTGWTGDSRRDGVKIERRENGLFVALHPGGEKAAACPCCNNRLLTARAARLVADYVWPLDSGR